MGGTGTFPGTLFMKTDNGEWVPVGKLQNVTLTEPLVITPRKLSRKRFVKLLMADGWSRNAANSVAKAALKYKHPYAEALWRLFICGYYSV